MPKMKTHRGSAKRFRVTGSGKIMRAKGYKSHILTKKKHILRFLADGCKVKITIMFRGREMSHPDQGLSILERLADDLQDVAVIESPPKMEGRNMHMLIAPLPAAAKKKKEKEKSESESEGKDE